MALATREARERYPDLAMKWRDVYISLVGINDDVDLLRFQGDMWIDLILRATEDELARRGQPHECHLQEQ